MGPYKPLLLGWWLPCDIGGAKEPGMMYFTTKWGAKEPQNPQNHRVDEFIPYMEISWELIDPS